MLSIYMVLKKNIICKLYHIGIRCRKEGGGGVRTIQYAYLFSFWTSVRYVITVRFLGWYSVAMSSAIPLLFGGGVSTQFLLEGCQGGGRAETAPA